jgi:hypothetical protein
MAAITTGNFAKALYPGVNTWYGKAYSEFQPEFPKLFEMKTSRRAWEEDMSVSGFGMAVLKGEGAPVTYDTEQQGFMDRYTHTEYALGFIITRNMYEDDLYDVVGERKAKALARSIRHVKEYVGANILNRAFNSSYTYGDGQELVDSAHPNVAGGTWSNRPSVYADISEAALEQAVIDLGKYTDDRGLKIAVKSKALVVPVDLDFEVNKILKTEYEVGTANNTVNIVRQRFPGGVVMNPWLTDTDAWFIQTDVPNGLKFYERRSDTFSMDNDFDTDNAKFKVTSRFSFGASDKKAIYGSQGA